METLLAHIEAQKVYFLMITIYLHLKRAKVWKNIGKELVVMMVVAVTPMKKAMKLDMKKAMKLVNQKAISEKIPSTISVHAHEVSDTL